MKFGVKVILVLILLFMWFITIFTIKSFSRYEKLSTALQNSGITCKPVRVDDTYFCNTRIIINKKGDLVVLPADGVKEE